MITRTTNGSVCHPATVQLYSTGTARCASRQPGEGEAMMSSSDEQQGRALDAVRRYLPPQDSAGFNIITGECLGKGAPLSSKGKTDHASAVSSGTFRRRQSVTRPQETVTAKLTGKSRSKEDWMSDLAAAAAGSGRYGRRSPLRTRPPSAEASARPKCGRKVDPELHGYRREPVVTAGASSHGLRASDLTEPLFFPPRHSQPREEPQSRADSPEDTTAFVESGARRKGVGSEWPQPVSNDTMSALIRSPDESGAAAAVPSLQAEVDQQVIPAAPEAAAMQAESTMSFEPAEAAASRVAAGTEASPATSSRQPVVATPDRSRHADTSEAHLTPRSTGASPSPRRRPQSARRSESIHIERLARARDLVTAPPAGKPVMENRRPRVSSRRGSSAGQCHGALLASQWDGQGLGFATGPDAGRPSRRVEYVTATQDAQKSARSQLEDRGGERTVWNAPPVPQKASSASLRRRKSMPGFLSDGSSTDTCKSAEPHEHAFERPDRTKPHELADHVLDFAVPADTVARREALEVAAVVGKDAPVIRIDKNRKVREREQQWNFADVC